MPTFEIRTEGYTGAKIKINCIEKLWEFSAHSLFDPPSENPVPLLKE